MDEASPPQLRQIRSPKLEKRGSLSISSSQEGLPQLYPMLDSLLLTYGTHTQLIVDEDGLRSMGTDDQLSLDRKLDDLEVLMVGRWAVWRQETVLKIGLAARHLQLNELAGVFFEVKDAVQRPARSQATIRQQLKQARNRRFSTVARLGRGLLLLESSGRGTRIRHFTLTPSRSPGMADYAGRELIELDGDDWLFDRGATLNTGRLCLFSLSQAGLYMVTDPQEPTLTPVPITTPLRPGCLSLVGDTLLLGTIDGSYNRWLLRQPAQLLPLSFPSGNGAASFEPYQGDQQTAYALNATRSQWMRFDGSHQFSVARGRQPINRIFLEAAAGTVYSAGGHNQAELRLASRTKDLLVEGLSPAGYRRGALQWPWLWSLHEGAHGLQLTRHKIIEAHP